MSASTKYFSPHFHVLLEAESGLGPNHPLIDCKMLPWVLDGFEVHANHLHQRFDPVAGVIILCVLFPVIFFIFVRVTQMKIRQDGHEPVPGHHSGRDWHMEVCLRQKSLICSFKTDMNSNMPMSFLISSGVTSVQLNFFPLSRFMVAYLLVFSHNSLRIVPSKNEKKNHLVVGFLY